MSKTAAFDYNFLSMTLTGKPIANLCSTTGSTALWLSLHTADPGGGGSTAAEGGYAAYTRASVDRSTGATGWTVTSGTSSAPLATATPNTAVSFPQNTAATTGTFTYMAIWPSSNGAAGTAFYTGTISPSINFSQNVTPQLTTSSSVTET
jgi:hypothetical protein